MKLKYKSSDEFQEFLLKLRKQYSCLFRYAYNRLFDGKTKKEIYHLIQHLNNIELVKSRMINDVINDANNLYEKDKESNHKSIFGTKKEFIRRCKNLISRENFKEKKLRQLYIQGETTFYGNRHFNLIILNNKIIFKYDRKNHFILDITASKNQLKQLYKLQELCEKNQAKFTITMDEKEINISFDEIKSEEKIEYIENRFIGIDMNPNYVGVSILEFTNELKVLKTYMFNLKEITSKIINKNEDLNDKLSYEIFEISKRISNISKHWFCKFIFIEDLEFKNKDQERGKKYNILTKCLWKRNKFIENFNKRCNMNNQKLFKVCSVYSSIIGNCMFEYPDPINASIEIGRRGYEVIILKNKKFYPTFGLKESLIHRWKETVNDIPDNWKEFFVLLKNSKLSYRVPLEECQHSYNVFRKNSRMIDIYQEN